MSVADEGIEQQDFAAGEEADASNSIARSSDGEAEEGAVAKDARGGEVASSPAVASAAPPRLSPVESMEVRIDFEVGRVVLPVSSLANVAAGSVVEVPGVSLDRVVAKSGGHAFAFGEFVELGGRVGFRILRLADAKEKR